jgi:hypothetical protein
MSKADQPWKTDELQIMHFGAEDADTEALDLDWVPGREIQLLKVSLTTDLAVVASENFTITFTSNRGAKFSYVIDTPQDMQGLTEHVVDLSAALEYFEAGDSFNFAFANTDGNGWGLLVRYREKS